MAVADRTNDILRAACRVIAERGCDGMRMGDVARSDGRLERARALLLRHALGAPAAERSCTRTSRSTYFIPRRGRALREARASASRPPSSRTSSTTRRSSRAGASGRRCCARRSTSPRCGRTSRTPTGRGSRRSPSTCAPVPGPPSRRRGHTASALCARRRPRRAGAARRHRHAPGHARSCATPSPRELAPMSIAERSACDAARARLCRARGLRGRARRRLRALVDLRVPRAHRGRAGLVRDRQRRRRAGRCRARRRRRAARALERLPPPRDADPLGHRHVPEGAAAARTTAGHYRQDGAARGRPRGAWVSRARPRGRGACRRSASNRSRASCSSRSTTTSRRSPTGSAMRASASSRWASRPFKAVGPLVAEYPYNWKNLADNYLEGYHIPVGHPGPAADARLQALPAPARPPPRLDQRAAARQAICGRWPSWGW